MIWIVYSKKLIDIPQVYHGMLKSADKKEMPYEFYFYEDFSVQKIKGKETLFYKDTKIETLPEFVLLRGRWIPLQHFLDKKKIRTLNTTRSIELIRDKYKTYKHIKKYAPHILQPQTILQKQSYKKLVQKLGSPFIVKNKFGSKGSEVYLVSSENEFQKVLDTTSHNLLIYQKYIRTSYGKDIRVYLIGNTIAGAMIRENIHDFRSNISQGASYRPFPLDDQLKNATLTIGHILGLEFGAIDFLFGENDYYFCEANTNAGFDGFAKAGIICQDILMDYIKTLLKNKS